MKTNRLNDEQIKIIRTLAVMTHIAAWNTDKGDAGELYENIARSGISYVGRIWSDWECVAPSSAPIDFMTIGLKISIMAYELEDMYLKLKEQSNGTR